MTDANTEEMTILFADLVGSLQAGDYLTTPAYVALLDEYQETLHQAVWTANSYDRCSLQNMEVRLAGDELVAFFNSGDSCSDVVQALDLAVDLKVAWLTSKTNRERVCAGKRPMELAVGVNTGDTVIRQRVTAILPRDNDIRRKTAEGMPISVAKRLEGIGHTANLSRIIAGAGSRRLATQAEIAYEFELHAHREIRGMALPLPAYELVTCWSFQHWMKTLDDSQHGRYVREIAALDPTNLWLQLWSADAFALARRYDAAAVPTRRALYLKEGSAQAHFILAEMAGESGDTEQAREHLEWAVEAGGPAILRMAANETGVDTELRMRSIEDCGWFQDVVGPYS